MMKFILVPVLALLLGGCSFLPRFTFDKPGVTPTQTEKSSKRETCAGDYKIGLDGNMVSCSKGYKLQEQNYKQADRKYTITEKIANFIRNLTGWGLPIMILAVIFIPGFGGALIGFIFHNLFGVASRGFKALVTGIQNGKNYVRSNGVNYTEAERLIYLKGADDMLSKITESITDQKIKDQIALIRAKL
jgi:hypothetical protein